MRLAITLPQTLCRYVRIDLRRRQVLVSKQFLHTTYIGTVVQQMGSEGVSQGVRRRARVDTRST